LSTMALWTLEGAILYGLVLGYTWYLQSVGSRWSEALESPDPPAADMARQ